MPCYHRYLRGDNYSLFENYHKWWSLCVCVCGFWSNMKNDVDSRGQLQKVHRRNRMPLSCEPCRVRKYFHPNPCFMLGTKEEHLLTTMLSIGRSAIASSRAKTASLMSNSLRATSVQPRTGVVALTYLQTVGNPRMSSETASSDWRASSRRWWRSATKLSHLSRPDEQSPTMQRTSNMMRSSQGRLSYRVTVPSMSEATTGDLSSTR